MDDKELLIRLTVLVEQMGQKVAGIENKVNTLNDIHLMKTESRLAVGEEKVSRLEKIVYGSIGLILAEGVTILFLWLKR